jgi:hypothetical protein
MVGSEADLYGKAPEDASVPNESRDKRRDLRYEANNAITFSHLNKNENYIGIVRNFSRNGMAFTTTREINPGSCIVIIPLVCGAADPLWGDGECGAVADSVCATENRPDPPSEGFINMVTAKVVRCESFKASDKLRYSVAVSYLRPAV